MRRGAERTTQEVKRRKPCDSRLQEVRSRKTDGSQGTGADLSDSRTSRDDRRRSVRGVRVVGAAVGVGVGVGEGGAIPVWRISDRRLARRRRRWGVGAGGARRRSRIRRRLGGRGAWCISWRRARDIRRRRRVRRGSRRRVCRRARRGIAARCRVPRGADARRQSKGPLRVNDAVLLAGGITFQRARLVAEGRLDPYGRLTGEVL